jgi:putative ABC transport system permease protein
MGMRSRLLAPLRRLFGRRAALRELDDELQFHLEQETAAHVARGLLPEEARRIARRDLGGLSQTREAAGNVYRFRFESIWRDAKLAARSLRRTPAFTITALVTLVLAIGANSAVFSVYYGVLRRPLPYRSAEQLAVVIRDQQVTGAQRTMPASFNDEADISAWRAGFTSFESTALYATAVGALRTSEGADLVDGAIVSDSFFTVVGGDMAAGRPITGTDDRATAIVISERLARRLFGSAGAAVGQPIVIGTSSRVVTGVAATSFQIPTARTDYWNLPRSAHASGTMIGRLRPGREVADASAEAGRLAVSLRMLPDAPKGMSARVVGLRDRLTDSARSTVLLLCAAAALLLLAACANVANLALARQTDRSRQSALQFALGASRARLAGQQILETAMLAGTGTAVGLVVARIAVAVVGSSAGIPRADAIRLDWPVLIFSTLLLAVTTCLVGLLPAMRLRNLADVLKSSGPHATSNPLQRAVNNVLCVAQLAVSVILLVGATLLGRSLYQLLHTDLGIAPDHVITASMNVIVSGRPHDDESRRRFGRVVESVRSLPGVTDVGLGTAVPPVVSRLRLTLNRPGDEHLYQAFAVAATPEYFSALRTRVVAGRLFTAEDDLNHPPVMIMSVGTARRFFGDADPIGHTLNLPTIQDGGKGPNVAATLVGLVSEVKYSGIDAAANDEVYRPFAQMAWGAPFLVVRTTVNPESMIQSVRRTIARVDRDIVVSDVKTVDTIVDEATATPRFRTVLVAAISGLAITIAGIGLCGVSVHAVTRRTREIGIRMALGAGRSNILTMVLRHGIGLGLTGAAIGVGAAYAGARLITGLLYGITMLDPLSYVSACTVVLAISAIATYVPARRAARVDPLVVLRTE